jgi:hypothetical protein
MLIPKINIGKLLDPVTVQQVIKYQGNLTVTSNDTNVIPRDDAGNVQLQEDSESNPLLIIEPVATKITLNSVLKVLDTRFQYFKFPATTRVIGTDEVDIDLTLPEFEDTINTIKTEYTLPITYDSQNQPNEFIRLNTSYNSLWYYNDGTTLSAGFKQLPFAGENQTQLNGYTITQNTIDLLRSKNKTLKFTINTQIAYNTSISNNIIRLIRDNPKFWRIWQIPRIDAETSVENPAPILSLTYILNTSDLVDGDFYYVDAVSGGENTLYGSRCYWTIEEVDIPIEQSLSNTISYGVYAAQGDTLRIINSYVPTTDPPTNAEILKINL